MRFIVAWFATLVLLKDATLICCYCSVVYHEFAVKSLYTVRTTSYWLRKILSCDSLHVIKEQNQQNLKSDM